MRIAYLVSRYPATNHTFILREIRALRSLGFDIQVIAIRVPGQAVGMTAVERVELERTFSVLPFRPRFALAHLETVLRHPFGYVRGIALALRMSGDGVKVLRHLVYFAEAVAAGRQIERAGIYHVHVHFSSTVGLILSRIFPIGFSATIHGPDEFNDVVGFRLAEKVAAAAFICAISSYARSQLMRASGPEHWNKLEVCRLGVDPDVFCARAHRDSPERFELICVGRLAPVKAQQVLIAACARLVADGRKLRLRVVGDGPDRARLEQFAHAAAMTPHVLFEGALNQDDVIARYKESDIFALASFAEGVPVVLMEAMAMEIPCVATWVNGVPELIRDGVDGILVPPSDVAQLAAAIERLMDDAELREQIGKSARRRVIEEYNLESNAARMADIFRRRIPSAEHG